MTAYRVATAPKVPTAAGQQSDCCEQTPVLRVRVELEHRAVVPHVYIVCGDPEHWLWAHTSCQRYVDQARKVAQL